MTLWKGRWPPLIDPGKLPEAEREAARNASQAFAALPEHIDDFAIAVELFNEQRALYDADVQAQKPSTNNYRRMILVCRAAVLAVYDFNQTVMFANISMGRSETICSALDVDLMNKAEAMRERHFPYPHWKGIRHAVAHRAEVSSGAEEWGRHAIPMSEVPGMGGTGTVVVSDSINGQRFTMTWKKKLVTLVISTGTAETLATIMRAYWDAGDALEASLRSRNAGT